MKKTTWRVLGLAGLVILANAACGGDDTAVPATSNTTGTDAGTGTGTGTTGTDAGSTEKPEVKPGAIVVSALSSPTIGEEGTSSTFTVKLADKPTSAVSIQLSVDDATEAKLDKLALTFTPDNFDTAQTVTITGVDDAAADGDQTVLVSFAPSVSDDTRYAGLSATPFTIKNVDDDTAGIAVTAPANATTSELGASVKVSVRLRSKPQSSVYVPVASSNEAEGKADVAGVLFTPDNYFIDQTITVTGQADAVKDGSKAYDVKFGKTQSPGDAAYKDLEATASFTNKDQAVEQIAGNWTMACARYTDGRVQCWGRNDLGGSGYGDTNSRGDQPGEMANLPFVDLGTGHTAKQLVGSMDSEGSMCAVRDDDSIVCWGFNDYGSLGLGNTNRYGDQPGEMGDALPPVLLGAGRKAKQLSYASWQGCAILDNDQLKCWGENNYGGLGQGDTTWRNQANQIGDNLTAIDLGAGRTAKRVVAGFESVCAILDNDKLKCWGKNNNGVLGLGDTNHRGDNPNEMGDSLPYVDLGTNLTAKDVAIHANHACAILNNDKVKCWGSNYVGQLGLGDTAPRGVSVGQMGDNLAYVDLGNGRTAKALVPGWEHTCAILDDDSIKCWGRNSEGQLGQNDTVVRGDNPNEMGDNLPPIQLGAGRKQIQVVGTTYGSCALLDNGAVKCWGYNGYGVQGQGDQLSRGTAAGQMGDALPRVPLKW